MFLLICTGLFAQTVSLDQAVQSSARTIESRLRQGSKTAVLAFTSASQAFSDYIVDELAIAISANNKLIVIERQYTDVIRNELNIQMSGDVSDDEVKRVGIQLGAQYVVTGSLVDIGNAYRFRVVAINVETAVREASVSLNISVTDPQVTFLLTGQRVQTGNITAPAGSSPVINSGLVYSIGDTGPGGGIVFYDKGILSNGWRYLEAAPAETEFGGVQWGPINNEVYGTATAIGTGKRNTQLIIERLRQLGQNGKAAQLCAGLDFNGFTDWFLPSRDELDLMNKNLRQKGLGGFPISSWYWSSSQINSDQAYIILFNGGNSQLTNYKTQTHSVRAIRSF